LYGLPMALVIRWPAGEMKSRLPKWQIASSVRMTPRDGTNPSLPGWQSGGPGRDSGGGERNQGIAEARNTDADEATKRTQWTPAGGSIDPWRRPVAPGRPGPAGRSAACRMTGGPGPSGRYRRGSRARDARRGRERRTRRATCQVFVGPIHGPADAVGRSRRAEGVSLRSSIRPRVRESGGCRANPAPGDRGLTPPARPGSNLIGTSHESHGPEPRPRGRGQAAPARAVCETTSTRSRPRRPPGRRRDASALRGGGRGLVASHRRIRATRWSKGLGGSSRSIIVAPESPEWGVDVSGVSLEIATPLSGRFPGGAVAGSGPPLHRSPAGWDVLCPTRAGSSSLDGERGSSRNMVCPAVRPA
jgi:hypothetical protein